MSKTSIGYHNAHYFYSTASPFGSGGEAFGGLGGKPSAEKANTNVFGSATFGSPGTPCELHKIAILHQSSLHQLLTS